MNSFAVCNWIFTPLLPFEGTSRHPQLCQGWVPELNVAAPLAQRSLYRAPAWEPAETPTAAAATCHLPVQWQGCDTCQHHLLPLHLLNHSSCCWPCPRAHPPHLFLRTSLQNLCNTSTLEHNKDATWATCPCSGGRWSLLSGGQGSPCALQASTSLSHSSVSVSQPKPYLCTTPTCYLAHIPRPLVLMAQPCFSAALQPLLMSSSPFTCTGEGQQGAGLWWIIQTSFHTTGRLRATSLTTGEDLGYVTTPCMSQQASAPKHSFGQHLSFLVKYLKPREV